MIRYFAFLILLSLNTGFIVGQNAISELIKSNSKDAEMVKRLKEFEKGGIEKPFDYENVSPEMFIKQARKYMGAPYKYGGMSKSGIDCSGLIVKTMEDLGLYAPHSALELARFGKIILDKNKLQPGDFIFFTKTYNTPKLVSHAGFVIEDDNMLHASSSKGVSITAINNPYYWDKYFLFGTRIFEDVTPIIAAVTIPVGFTERIMAGIYDVKFKGKYTDSGEKYKAGNLTASHPSLPFGAIIRVTNLKNGRSVKVRINDGDSGRDNINLTLSKKASRKLRIKKGSNVEVDIIVIK